jgi:hypothetical protein
MTSLPRARHHAGLSRFLVALKDRCGLAFTELAARTAGLGDATAVSASTLKRAAAGHDLPQEHVVTAYVRACGATAEEEVEALRLWRAARALQRGVLATLRAPAVRSIRTPADFDAALVAVYERAGAPPLRVLQERATTDEEDGALILPLTTLWRITRREARPAAWDQCAAYLRGCGIHPRRTGPWREAWQRIHTAAQAEPAPAASTRRGLWWTDTIRLSLPLAPLTDGAWPAAPDHPAVHEPYAHALVDQLGPREDAPVPAVSRAFGGLGPADQYAVLAAGLTHLATARGRARRNGAAPDTGIGIDAIGVRDGRLVLLQCKHSGDTTSGPPGADGVPAPGLPPRPPGPGRSPARRARQAVPA